METKLRLVLEKIHWSLIFKSFIVGLSWLFLPFWLFLTIVLFFYFIPIFRINSLFFQLLIFIFVAKIITLSFWNFLLISILFFLILGIKDLVIIHRGTTYEFLGLLIFFVLGLKFFEKLGGEFNWPNLILSLFFSILFFLFFKNQIFFEKKFNELNYFNFKIGLSVVAFLIWQLILVLNFLPINFYLQTAILILFISIGFEIILNYVIFGLNKQFILGNILIFFIIFILILIFNNWSL